jgi:hypothetical protein
MHTFQGKFEQFALDQFKKLLIAVGFGDRDA